MILLYLVIQTITYALARIPKAGETRGNLAAGGTGIAQLLSPLAREKQVFGQLHRDR